MWRHNQMGQVLNTLSDDAINTLSAEARAALDGGDISALLALHRETFGGFRMEDDGGDDGGDSGDGDEGDEGDNDDGDGDGDEDEDDDADPEQRKAMLKQARQDAAKRRTQAREARQQASAEKARADKAEQELARLRKAAGAGDDNADDNDNDDQTNADRERADKAEAKARDLAVQVQVSKLAGKHKADVSALLDSRAFLASVEGLDPEDADFADEVADAIKAAVKKNPALRKGQGSARGGAEFNGGSGERGKRPKSIAEAVNRRMAKR